MSHANHAVPYNAGLPNVLRSNFPDVADNLLPYPHENVVPRKYRFIATKWQCRQAVGTAEGHHSSSFQHFTPQTVFFVDCLPTVRNAKERRFDITPCRVAVAHQRCVTAHGCAVRSQLLLTHTFILSYSQTMKWPWKF